MNGALHKQEVDVRIILLVINNSSSFLYSAQIRHSMALKALYDTVFPARYVGLRLNYET